MATPFLILSCISLIALGVLAIYISKIYPDQGSRAAIHIGIVSSLPSAVIVGLFISGTGIYIQERDAVSTRTQERLDSKRSVLMTLQSELARMNDALLQRMKFKPSVGWTDGERDQGLQSRADFIKMQIPVMTEKPLSGGYWQSLSNSGQTALLSEDNDLLLQASTAYDLINSSISCEQRVRDLIFSVEAATGFQNSAEKVMVFWEEVAKQCLVTYGIAASRVGNALADIGHDLQQSH